MTLITRLFRCATAIVLLSGLAACVSIEPTLDADITPDAKSAYISGEFTRSKFTGIAYVVESVDGKNQYLLPMGKDTAMPSAVKLQTVAMKIPPGTYHIIEWVTYATVTKEIFRRNEVKNPFMREPFTIKAGNVVHLGRFEVDGTRTTNYPTTYMKWSVVPQPIMQSDAQSAFVQTYPKLADLPFRCVMCVDTVMAAAKAVAP